MKGCRRFPRSVCGVASQPHAQHNARAALPLHLTCAATTRWSRSTALAALLVLPPSPHTQVVPLDPPHTTASYRAWCVEAIAADIKDTICRVSDNVFDPQVRRAGGPWARARRFGCERVAGWLGLAGCWLGTGAGLAIPA